MNVQNPAQGLGKARESGEEFRGVGLVASIKRELLDFMRVGRLDSLADAVGRDAAAVTAEPWPA